MTIKRVKLSEARKTKGKSRKEFLENMTEEELLRRAESDPDNPPLTDEQLAEFSIARNKDRKNEEG